MEKDSKTELAELLVEVKNSDLTYWSDKFGISKDELLEAVKAGESSTVAIEKYVKKELADA
jgi:hypothetical protein